MPSLLLEREGMTHPGTICTRMPSLLLEREGMPSLLERRGDAAQQRQHPPQSPALLPSRGRGHGGGRGAAGVRSGGRGAAGVRSGGARQGGVGGEVHGAGL
eukprot:gene8536-biopygen757